MNTSILPENCIQVNENVVLIRANHQDEITVTGRVNVKAIRGSIQILGFQITPDKPPITVFSMKEFNTLKITCSKSDIEYQDDKLYLETLNVKRDKISEILKKCRLFPHVYVVSLNKDLEDDVAFLKKYEFPLFTREMSNDPFIKLTEMGDNNVIENQKWETLADSFMSNSKVVLCGGKNVGKSTLLRYLVNRSLAKWREVLVIDFDPGQSEFTVMGCLSAVLVRQPLLGPNFSHLTTPVRSLFLGDTSVANCEGLYLKYVENLAKFCNKPEYENIPWLINTMGFTKGIGITFLGAIIKSVKPTDVVQINSEIKQYDFPVHVTPEYFRYHGNYRLHLFPSMGTVNKNGDYSVGNMEPATRRNIVTVSYFKKAISGNVDLFGINPRKIKMDSVEIVIRKPSSGEIEMTLEIRQKLCCINANMVALCYMDEADVKAVHCLGFGIVRGYDIDTKDIYIITPLSDDELKNVTTIQMCSNILLPQNVYKNQVSRVYSSCPYITYKKPDQLNQPFKRTSSRLKYPADSRNSSECYLDSSRSTH